jgi:phospholipase C
MNGFIDAVAKEGLGPDPSPMGYYDRRDLPYHWRVADRYVLFDRFFQSAHAGSVPNHMYWVTGTVGNPDGHHHLPREGFGDLPTIFDRLEAKGISWKVYVQNYQPSETFRTNIKSNQVHWVPLLNFPRYIDNPRLFRHIVDLDEYYEDLEKGTLPAVSYIVPSGASEHPPGSLREGQRFVSSLINSLMQSRFWDRSAFMYAYDDWGGWYDHVRPPIVDSFGYGFRVPALLVSPYARRGYIDSTTLDFTSILKFIERNWDLRPLASRDARARSIAGAFDFSRPPRDPQIITATPRAKPHKETKRVVIYGAYGTALGLASIVIVLQLLSSLNRRPRAGARAP